MNPELQRNLWLEATPVRLALIAGLLLLVFTATSVSPIGLAAPSGVALALYWFFAVLWGTRNAALSVVAEIRERTWDGQKLSAIGPFEMMWGKLFGATAANWFGALLCLPLALAPAWRDEGAGAAITYGVILLALGVFAQALALLSSLVLIRRNTGNWRLDTFLCQVAGVGGAFAYYSLWNSIAALARNGSSTLVWWGHDFDLNTFHLASLLLFLGWALVGCWRTMRAELRLANGPWVWLAYLAYAAIYSAGFAGGVSNRLPEGFHLPAIPLALAALTLLSSTYSMVFLEPKDPVRLRWLGEQIRAGQWMRAFVALDCWMLSYAATLCVGLVLAALWTGSPFALTVLAMLGFLTRDVAIFVLMRAFAGNKGDFAALALLAALYLPLPLVLRGVGLSGLQFLLVPTAGGTAALGLVVAWAQGIGAAWLAAHSIGKRLNAP